MQRVIINADDLGFNTSVNIAIEEGLKARVITSSTIMAAGQAVDDVCDIVQRYPDASFGVHLCLDEVKPVSKDSYFAKCGALDSSGVMIKGWYKGVNSSSDLIAAIYNEWQSQIALIQSLGVKVSHIDSHHHAHNLPYLKGVLCRLSKDFGIDKVRLPLYTPPMLRYQLKGSSLIDGNFSAKKKQGKVQKIAKYIMDVLSKEKELKWMKHTFSTTDFFCHAGTFFTNQDVLKRYNTIEIMCHPGHPAYQKETDCLYSFEKKDIQLISYNDL